MSGFAAALAAAVDGQGPDTVALMRLLAEAETEAAARMGLEAARGRQGTRAPRLLALWDAHPHAWSVVRTTIGSIAHQRPAADPEAILTYWAETFDRLVEAAPEASVALYSLGSPDLLVAATNEIVDRMAAWSLLGPDRDVLDLGCGIGRFVIALAPRVRHVTGLDIAARMVAEAQRRCSTLNNVTLRQSNGRSLAGVADASLDLILAADVFPYLVEAGHEIAAIHVHEAARVLRPNGALLILNYSYRGDRAADGRDIHHHATEAFRVERDGTAEFTLWDGATFLLRRKPQA